MTVLHRLVCQHLVVLAMCVSSVNLPAQEVFQGTIKDFVLLALEQNQELEVQRISPLIQQETIDEAWGIFDPRIVSEFIHEEKETNVDQRTFNSLYSSLFGPADPTSIYHERNSTYRVGVEGIFDMGTQYQLFLQNRKLVNDTNAFDSEFTSDTILMLTQPVLKGFGKDVNLAKVSLAKSDLKREKYRLASVVNRMLGDTMVACVELIFAQKNLEVKQESIALAEELYEGNKKTFELGRMSEIDVLQAEGRVSEAREEELQARTFLIERTNDLKALVVADFAEKQNVDFQVIDELNTEYKLPKTPDLLQTALKNNADYLAAEQYVESQDIAVKVADNGLKPQVDLIGSVSLNGLDFDDPIDAISDYQNRNKPSWSLGVAVSYPIGNQSAKAAKRRALLQRRQARMNVSSSKVQLSARLDSAVKIVEIAYTRIAISKMSVELARKSLDAEVKRLKLGTTTSFNVAEMQKNLSVARTRQLAAVVEYEKALIKLWGLVGILKDRMDVAL